jgi:xanthine dehydrogenase YagS FAD-binding subunit
MKAFTNVSPSSLAEAVAQLQAARARGEIAYPAGGGSDLLGMIKDELVPPPDVLVDLKRIAGVDGIEMSRRGASIGGLATVDAVSRDSGLLERYPVLVEAAGAVGTPQIRNMGTIAGNVCQRPWCPYFRQGFACLKRGGDRCYSVTGEHQQHAIFGAGPSFIVHPSDTANAFVALDAAFRILGPGGERAVPAAEFFVPPRTTLERENVLRDDELLIGMTLPREHSGRRGTYRKIMDREAWTHAVVSLALTLDMDGDFVRDARIVLGGVAPIPWRVPAAEDAVRGKRIDEASAAAAGEAAIAGAQPLPKNAYKVGIVRSLVRRTLLELGGSRA